jgi:lipopolysaccharide assembly outer membrane protein LptD (OstA)
VTTFRRVAAVLLCLAPAALQAQRPTRPRVPPTPPVPPARTQTPTDTAGRGGVRDTTRAGAAAQPGDSAAADTTRRELVKWAEPDSVMGTLMEREGYTTTRYQGDVVTFDARNSNLVLQGGPAAVAREQTVLVGDTVIYNDSTQVVRALGDTVILRDPSRGEDDLTSYGHIVYSIGQRRGQVSNVRTAVVSGEKWFVGGREAAFRTDTGSQSNAAFYARGGAVTSCNDSVPHYHFESQELKLVRNRILVSRPAVLYIYDVPVMWLPFVFQDLREGRRSGILTPRFGIAELLRNSPTYRRTFDNLGYYFAISDYMDASVSLDWLSGARPRDENDNPGFVRYNGEWNYRWLDRFLQGRMAASYLKQRDDNSNFAVSWGHSQEFSQRTRLTTDVNYVTSTRIQRQTSYNPYQVLATIQSRANFQSQLGPATFSIGGSQKQYPGREQMDREFPNLSISTRPVTIGDWFTWTPTLSANNSVSLNNDQTGSSGLNRYFINATGGGLDSSRIRQDIRRTSLNFTTPIRFFGFTWQNSFNVSDNEDNFPSPRVVEELRPRPDGGVDTVQTSRVFARTYLTSIDWQTGINLPSLFQGTWNLTPSVQIVNTAPGAFWVRSERTGERYVTQSKRLQYGVSMSPTFFGLFPGFGPVSRFRHSVNPSITYNYAPEGKVSDEYLAATGRLRQGYLGSLAQNSVSLSLQQNVEAKLRSEADTSPEGGKKVKVLSISADPLTYDFVRIAELRRRSEARGGDPSAITPWAGLTNSRFSYRLSSDLVPGFSFQSGYSLFLGDPQNSDTAEFKPYRESISASFSVNRRSGIFAALSRVFGRAVPLDTREAAEVAASDSTTEPLSQRIAGSPVAGTRGRAGEFEVPTGQGFQASFTLTSSRQRPVRGGVQVNVAERCEVLRDVNPVNYQQCLADPSQFADVIGLPGTDSDLFNQTTAGGPIYRSPPITTLQSQTSFNITPKWAAQWATTYDLRNNEFASHIVSLQRDLHDWRAIFSFTQSPNGAFAFTFFISLKAQPELKFNYDRQSYGRQQGTQ